MADQPATVVVWAMPSGNGVARLAGHGGPVFGLAFDHDGKRLASASLDRTVKVWDVAAGGPLLTYRGHDGWVEGVAFEPRGRRIASTGTDGSVRLWDSQVGTEIAVFMSNADDRKRVISRIDASKGGMAVAGEPVGRPDQLKVWNSATGQGNASWRAGARLAQRRLHAGWALLAASFASTVRIYDVNSLQPVLTRGHTDLVRHRLRRRGRASPRPATTRASSSEPFERRAAGDARGHAAPSTALAFRADGTQLASTSWDGGVRVWDLTRTGESLVCAGTPTMYAASPSRRTRGGSPPPAPITSCCGT